MQLKWKTKKVILSIKWYLEVLFVVLSMVFKKIYYLPLIFWFVMIWFEGVILGKEGKISNIYVKIYRKILPTKYHLNLFYSDDEYEELSEDMKKLLEKNRITIMKLILLGCDVSN